MSAIAQIPEDAFHCAVPAASGAAGRPLSLGLRYVSFASMLLVCAALAWLWAGSPFRLRCVGLGYALLAVLSPVLFFDLLALTLPWLVNQPNPDQHTLLLFEYGLMGLVIHHQALRAVGLAPRRASRIDAWLAIFVFYSCFTIISMRQFILTEWDAERWGELYANLRHYGTSPTFGYQAAFKLLLAAGLFQALRDRPWGEARLRRFFLLALAGLAFASALGVLEYFHAISLTWWRPDNPDVIRNGFRRLQSLAGHPGWFAEYLGMLAPSSLALGLAAPRPWQRRLGWALAIALTPVQMLTEARGGWFALAAGYAVVLLGWSLVRGDPRFRGGRWRRVLAALGLLAALILACGGALWLFSPDFRTRSAGIFMLRDRTAIWLSAIEIANAAWLTGIGLGAYNLFHSLVYPVGHPFHELDKVTAHSLLLHIWVERGVIGLVLFLGILAGIARSLFAALARIGRGAAAGLPLDLTLAALGGLTAFFVDGLVQYGFYIREVEVLFWMLAAFSAWAAGPVPVKAKSPRLGWMIRLIPLALALTFAIDRRMYYTWRVGLDGENLYVAGKRVELPIPAAGDRFILPLGAMYPGLEIEPQVITVEHDGKPIASVVFHRLKSERVEIDLPANRPSGDRIVVTASKVWRPLRDSGMRDPPFPEVGVMYGFLRPAGSNPATTP